MCALAVLALAGCDWAEFGFGPANTGNNAFEPAIAPASVAHLTVAWSQPCVCGSIGRPLVTGGAVYTVESTNTTTSIRVFDAQRGTPKWSRVVTTDPSRTDTQLAAIGNGLVYLIVGRSVVALDAGAGSVRWVLEPPIPGTGTITVTHLLLDGTVAFVNATASIANANPVSEISALDTAGHIIWSNTPGGEVGGFAGAVTNSQPDSTARTLDVVSQIQTSQPSSVVLVTQYDEGSGFLNHRVVVNAGTDVDPRGDVAASGGLVFFHAAPNQGRGPDGSLFAVDPMTGAVAWSAFGNDAFAVSPSIVASVGQNRFIFALEGIDARSGRLLWGPVSGQSPPAIANGVVFTTGGLVREVLEARDLTNGSLVGSFSVANESLSGAVTPANGRIYVGSSQRLYALTPTPG
jgi:hypothetical protein